MGATTTTITIATTCLMNNCISNLKITNVGDQFHPRQVPLTPQTTIMTLQPRMRSLQRKLLSAEVPSRERTTNQRRTTTVCLSGFLNNTVQHIMTQRVITYDTKSCKVRASKSWC